MFFFSFFFSQRYLLLCSVTDVTYSCVYCVLLYYVKLIIGVASVVVVVVMDGVGVTQAKTPKGDTFTNYLPKRGSFAIISRRGLFFYCKAPPTQAPPLCT